MDILPRLCKWTRDVPLWEVPPNKCVAAFNEVLLSACIDWGVRCSLSHDAFMDAKDNPRSRLFLSDGLHPSYSGIKVMLAGLVGFQSFAQYGKLNLIPSAVAKLGPTPAPLRPITPVPVTCSLNQVSRQHFLLPPSAPELTDVHFPPLHNSSPLTPTSSNLNYRGALLSTPKMVLPDPVEVKCIPMYPARETISDTRQRPQRTVNMTTVPMKKAVERCRRRKGVTRSCNVMVYDPSITKVKYTTVLRKGYRSKPSKTLTPIPNCRNRFAHHPVPPPPPPTSTIIRPFLPPKKIPSTTTSSTSLVPVDEIGNLFVISYMQRVNKQLSHPLHGGGRNNFKVVGDDLTRSEYKVLSISRLREQQTDQQREEANKRKKEFRESVSGEKRKHNLADSKSRYHKWSSNKTAEQKKEYTKQKNDLKKMKREQDNYDFLQNCQDLFQTEILGPLGCSDDFMSEDFYDVPNSPVRTSALSEEDKRIINTFREHLQIYPDLKCQDCNKLYFSDKISSKSGKVNSTNYICDICSAAKKKGKMSYISMKNNLEVGSLPDSLKCNDIEAKLISPRLEFMKIRSLPAGGQKAVAGPVINVPADPQEACLTLPRNLGQSGIIPVKLKRDIKHKSVVMDDYVNPDKLTKALIWLKENNPYFKNIVFNDEWFEENYPNHEDFFKIYFPNDPKLQEFEKAQNTAKSTMGPSDMPFQSCVQQENPDIADLIVHYAPGQGNKPIPLLQDKNAEVYGFPQLFPLGKGHFNDVRPNKLTMKKYAEHRLFNADRRFASNPEYIFFLQCLVEKEQLHSNISTHMRKGTKRDVAGNPVNARYLRDLTNGNPSLHSSIELYKFMKTMKGSPAYWQAVKTDALAMVSQLGAFTFFLTVSFNDLIYSIPAIMQARGQPVSMEYLENLSWYDKHEVLRSDPVTAVRMFKRFATAIINQLIMKEKVLGECEARAGRDEFQGRGSPHLHMLLKILNAPEIGVDDIATICAFIDRYITTKRPLPDEDPELAKLVMLQTHKHTKTCSKQSASKTSGSDTCKCRFDYPKEPSNETVIIIDPNGKKRPVIIYKRDVGDENVNTYNEVILRAVRSNMDIQYCGDAYSALMYLVSYATKQEKAALDALKNVQESSSMPFNAGSRETMRKLAFSWQNVREISIQEAIYRALPSIGMTYFSPQVIYIPCGPLEDQHSILKPKVQLDALPDDSTDIFMKGLRERYQNRPDDLENICFAEFASKYKPLYGRPGPRQASKTFTLKNGLGNIILRDLPVIVRSHSYSSKNEPHKFYYSKICQFHPWRSEADILGPSKNTMHRFHDCIDIIKANMMNYGKISSERMEDMLKRAHDEINSRKSEPQKNSQPPPPEHAMAYPPDGIQPAQENVERRSNCKFEYVEPTISTEALATMVSSLNTAQREFADMIDKHASAVADSQTPAQLLMFLSGAGGVGKSYVINCIRHIINSKFKDSKLHTRVVAGASTGVAAILINGQTIHTLLQFDTQRKGFFSIKPLAEPKRQTLYNFYKYVEYIIVDEVSMLGDTNLIQMNTRLNQIFGHSPNDGVLFGNRNILFVGDLFQIPPVMQAMVHKIRGIASLGTDIWKDKVKFHELTEIVRSKNDKPFTELCHRLRLGEHTPADTDFLQSKVVRGDLPIETLAQAMCIFPTNRMCDDHNQKCIKLLSSHTKMHTVKSRDKFSNSKVDHVRDIKDYMSNSLNDTCGLPETLGICLGARVMIRVNIDTVDKIVNGVCGTIKHIDFSNSSEFPTVWVKFDVPEVGLSVKHKCTLKCSAQCPLHECVPIAPLEKEFTSHRNKSVWVKRYQLPLQLSWACTVHKVQGLSLNDAYIWLDVPPGTKRWNWRGGQAYTAISRLTSSNGLHFLAFNPKEIRTSSDIVSEYVRLRTLSKYQAFDNPKSFVPSQIPESSQSPINNNKDPPCFNSNTSPHAQLPKLLSQNLSNVGNHTSPTLDSEMFQNNCIGRARVIDFMDSPKARYFAETLNDLGFQVSTTLSSAQEGNSCGYNSARVIAKLAHCDYSQLHDWFTVNVSDCCYSTTSANDLQSLMCEMANGHLEKRTIDPNSRFFMQVDPLPLFLTNDECCKLVKFYSETIYNENFATLTPEADRYAGIGLPPGTFERIVRTFVNKSVTTLLLPHLYIVNSHEFPGIHWFVVSLEIFTNRNEP